MSDASSLAAEAETVDSEAFLKLIDDVIFLLSTGRNTARNIEFLGSIAKILPKGEATIIGDIHGDLDSLLKILDTTKFIEKAQRNEDVLGIFLGDYGDRGVYSPEVYFVVLNLKRMFPERVILLRGNHEGPKDLLAYPHDLPFHLERKFSHNADKIYQRLTDLFELLLLAVIVDEKYVLLHGGVPNKASTIEDVAYACEKHPAESHLEEILWSDPVDSITGVRFSPRGAGRLFGKDVTDRFLRLLGAQMIIRGHEPSEDGYRLNHEGKALTLFSRKGSPYHNRQGAYLQIDLSKNLKDPSLITGFLKFI